MDWFLYGNGLVRKITSTLFTTYYFHIFYYIFRTFHFGNRIIISFNIAFHNMQHYSSMINDFHLLKFQISTKNAQCFKKNV